MANSSVEFSISIDGTAYQGIAKISEAISDYVETLEFI